MRQLMRETIRIVRAAGGKGVRVSQGGIHTRIHFTTRDGREANLVIHRGNIVTTRYAAMLRAQLRRRIKP